MKLTLGNSLYWNRQWAEPSLEIRWVSEALTVLGWPEPDHFHSPHHLCGQMLFQGNGSVNKGPLTFNVDETPGFIVFVTK